jgi:hypothetical protein
VRPVLSCTGRPSKKVGSIATSSEIWLTILYVTTHPKPECAQLEVTDLRNTAFNGMRTMRLKYRMVELNAGQKPGRMLGRLK